ncbi:twin-arginine translocase subunit TatC [Blastopirellula sp. JC732]|uniref:Sec-independent protein translocase protein TatC n=1 Tax=Blastopirellula sediminis TaxID=2894196 RepID=A0A9X1SMA2_9BACT|nr:twin-arginine translocase subunit TatC [Blastopirellula sediminis]MCC9605231.1 twin-arginine translocase subunit TatC [Blastopirellula sediminis]MCC9631469.1 twin-arginine translocase subunit TatC [Blastopirellula sediminis]
MAKKINDDLFEGSAMTFGEHLEELRSALFKSILWLAVGLAIGLLVADRAMDAIQKPVKEALVQYNQKRTLMRLQNQLRKETGSDVISPEDEARLKEIAQENTWSPEIIYIEPTELKRVSELKGVPWGTSAEPEQTPTDEEPQEEPKKDPGSESTETTEESPEVTETIQEMAIVPKMKPVPMITWKPTETSLTALKVEEVFMIWLKAGLVCGAIIASPGIFWHIWSFVAAGLYPHEKKYVWIYLPFSLGLFFGGAALAYFYVFAPVLEFLFSFNLSLGIDPDPRISEWMSFALLLPLGFGISFQLPLVMLLLNRVGLVEVKSYTEHWRIAILVICVLSALLTPADPLSMLLLAIPLSFLYFGGIGLCLWMPGRRAPMAPIR